MDIDNNNIASPEKYSLPNGKGLAKVKPFDQMVKRKAKFVIVPCTIPRESVCLYCQEKGHWMRSCHIYLKDRKDGKVKMYDSTPGNPLSNSIKFPFSDSYYMM